MIVKWIWKQAVENHRFMTPFQGSARLKRLKRLKRLERLERVLGMVFEREPRVG